MYAELISFILLQYFTIFYVYLSLCFNYDIYTGFNTQIIRSHNYNNILIKDLINYASKLKSAQVKCIATGGNENLVK